MQQVLNQAQQQPQAAGGSPQLLDGDGSSSCRWPRRVCVAVTCAALILACGGLALGITFTVKHGRGTFGSP